MPSWKILRSRARSTDAKAVKFAEEAVVHEQNGQLHLAEVAALRAREKEREAEDYWHRVRLQLEKLARKRLRDEEGAQNEKGKARPHKRRASEEPSPLVGWMFEELPHAQRAYQLPEKLPARLRQLLHLPAAWLKQLSLVKLKILARAYLKIHPGSQHSPTENELCDLMQAAIETMVVGWLPVNPAKANPTDLGHWEPAITSCLMHWLTGWAHGSRGRAINVCLDESGVDSEIFIQALCNPTETVIDTFVAALIMPGLTLEALMALLCAHPLLVQMMDMPRDAASLFKAVTAALAAAAIRIPSINPEPLHQLQAQRIATFGRMMRAIREQIGTPLIVIFDNMQEINSLEYEPQFEAALGEPVERSAEGLLQKANVVLEAVAPPLLNQPHFFYAAVSQDLGLRLLGTQGLLMQWDVTYNMNVVMLESIQTEPSS